MIRVSGELVLADRPRPDALESESLAARIDRETRLPAAEAVRIAAQCAKSLYETHRAGLVHGDVRPSNILLTRTGEVRLVGRQAATATATYLAPERALGAPPTTASDLYSLGVVLYRVLAGRPPFRERDREAMLAAHGDTAPDQLPVDVPPALARLCLQLMARDPKDRPASAAHVMGRLASRHILDPWPLRPEPRSRTVSAYRLAAARRAAAQDRAITVAPAPMILLTAAAAAALCLASAQSPATNGGGVHRVQTSVSATTPHSAGSPSSAAGSAAGGTQSPMPHAGGRH